MSTDLMTLPETAAYLNMTEKSLRWLRYTEQAPPAAKIGSRVTFRRSLVDQWIAEKFEASA